MNPHTFQLSFIFCTGAAPWPAYLAADTLMLGGRRELQTLLQCLLQAFAMELEKPNYRAFLFKLVMTEASDLSSGLGNVLLSAIPIHLFQRNTYQLFDSRCLCCTCLGALHTPLGKLSSGCYGLLTSVHQGSVLGSRWLLAVRNVQVSFGNKGTFDLKITPSCHSYCS